jgi:hypothetical protein
MVLELSLCRISNVGLSGTINITGNNIQNGTNSIGAFGIINSAAVGTANINSNVIRSHSRQQPGTLLEFQVQSYYCVKH